MFKLSKILMSIAITIALAGCAGKDFVSPTQETVKLGKTTYSQVIQQLGEPRQKGSVMKNDNDLKSINYAYAATGGEPLETGVIPA